MFDLSPTGSPGVDALLKTAAAVAARPDLKDSLEFSRHVQELQSFRRSLEKQFRDSRRLYPKTPLHQQLDEEFERFRGGGRRLESYLAQGRPEDLQVGCQRVHQAVTQLQSLSARLRAQEECWQQEYGSGLAGELKFLVGQTIQGAISQQQAAQVLEKSLEGCRGLEQAMAKVQPENEAVSEALDRCTVQLANFSRLLQMAIQSLRRQLTFELEERLADLVAGVDELSKAHRELMQALYPPVNCPRCGTDQPGERAYCQACSARLPLAVAAFLPEPPAPDARPRFYAFVEVEGKLEQWLRGEAEAAHCQGPIEGFLQRLSHGRRQMEKDAQLNGEMKQLLLEATVATEKALTALRQAVLRRDSAAADLEPLRAAEELMLKAQRRAEELQSTPNS